MERVRYGRTGKCSTAAAVVKETFKRGKMGMPGEHVIEEYRPDAYARTAASRPDRDAMLPALTDPYKAAGTADNGEVSRLVLIMGKDGFKPGATAYYLMQYVHIGLGEFGFDADGQIFRFVFSDIQPKLVTVPGVACCGYATISA